MSTHVVMEEPGRADRVVFVPDRFVLTAFLFPVLWLAWHRLWVEALVALAAGLALGALGTAWDVPAVPLALLVGLYLGLEGASLRIAALQRRGWRQAGVIEAANVREAELRYYEGTQAFHQRPAVPDAPRARPARTTPVAGGEPSMFGLIDPAGGR